MNESELIGGSHEIQIEDATVAIAPPQEEAESSPPSPPKKKKKRFFGIGLLLYTLLLSGLIGGVLWFLNLQLAQYESTTPNAAFEQFSAWIRQNNFEAIFEHSDFETTPLNTKKEYLRYLEKVLGGDPTDITFRERVSANEEEKLYSLYFDDTRVGIVALVQKENRWQVNLQPVFLEEYTIIAGNDARISVNGVDISFLGLVGEEIQTTVFSGATVPSVYPRVYRYTLTGLLNEPTIEALSLNGESCPVVNDKNDPQTRLILHPSSQEEWDVKAAFATEGATTYAEFIARDATRTELSKLIYKETSLYKAIRNFSNQWFSSHDSYEFQDMKLYNDFSYTDSDFTCDVSFQPVYTKNGKVLESEEAHYRITMLYLEDQWKIISLTPVTSENTTSQSDVATS